MAGWFSGALDQVRRGAEQLQGQAAVLSTQAREAGARVAEQVKKSAEDHGLKEAFQLDERYSAKGSQAGGAAPPWADVPEGWRGAEAAWGLLARLICTDDNTFLVGPQGRAPADGAPAEGPAAAVNWEWTEDDAAACTPSATAAVGQDETLAAVRLRLVPRWRSEREFWNSYFWKLRELGKAGGTQQACALLSLLNTDPAACPPGCPQRKKGQGILHGSEDPVRRIEERLEEAERGQRAAEDLARQCEEEVRTSNENIALLRRIRKRASPDPELLESVVDSCKYHLQRVDALLAKVDATPQEHRSALAPGSTLLEGLLEVKGALAETAAEHGAAPAPAAAAEQSAAPSSPPAKEQPPPAAAAAAPQQQQQHADPAPAPPSSPPAAVASPASGGADAEEAPAPGLRAAEMNDDYFGAVLPWEDEGTQSSPAAPAAAAASRAE